MSMVLPPAPLMSARHVQSYIVFLAVGMMPLMRGIISSLTSVIAIKLDSALEGVVAISVTDNA